MPADSPKRKEQYVLGDVNVSLIKTARGRTIVVQHCTNLPRPYSRIHMVQGTKGLFQGYPNRVYIEGRGKEDEWQDADEVAQASSSIRCGRRSPSSAQGAGHGGMDFIEDYRLIKCLREGQPTDMNVYDAAALSAVVASERAVGRAQGRAGRLPGLHARPLEDDAAARHRPHVADGDTSGARARPRSRHAHARGRSAARLTPDQQRAADAGRKAMMPINGRPFLDYVLSALADAGIRHVALVVAPDHDNAGAPLPRGRTAAASRDQLRCPTRTTRHGRRGAGG